MAYLSIELDQKGEISLNEGTKPMLVDWILTHIEPHQQYLHGMRTELRKLVAFPPIVVCTVRLMNRGPT